MLNHANNIRNLQSVPVAYGSIARQIVAEQYTRKPKVWLVCKSRSVPIVPWIWNRANKFVQVDQGTVCEPYMYLCIFGAWIQIRIQNLSLDLQSGSANPIKS
jgi:hypothetical protein